MMHATFLGQLPQTIPVGGEVAAQQSSLPNVTQWSSTELIVCVVEFDQTVEQRLEFMQEARGDRRLGRGCWEQ